MAELTEIPDPIVRDLRDASFTDDEIRDMSPRLLFTNYCTWNGIVGWGETLYFHAVELSKLGDPNV